MLRVLAAGPHTPPALLSGDGDLDGWTAVYRERGCACVRVGLVGVCVVHVLVSVRVRVASASWEVMPITCTAKSVAGAGP